MSDAFLLGFGIISGLAVWRYVVKPTYLDEARDFLFDLRDSELKSFFANSKDGLNDPLYVKMRELLNGLLRYTERASFASLIITVLVLARHKNQLKSISDLHDRAYISDDAEVTVFCRSIREKANAVMMRYMIRTSFLGQIIRFTAYGIAATRAIKCSITTFHKPIWAAACSTVTGFAIVTNVVAHVAPGVTSKTVQNAFEARALRQL